MTPGLLLTLCTEDAAPVVEEILLLSGGRTMGNAFLIDRINNSALASSLEF